MKKRKLNSLTSIVITMAVLLSCGGYLFADDTEQPEVTEETAVEQVQEEPEVAEVEEPVEEAVLDEEAPSEDAEIPEGAVIEEFTITGEDYAYDDSGYDSDYLSEQYIMQEMTVGPQVCYSVYNNQSNLPPIGQTAYSDLYDQICDIAAGVINLEQYQTINTEITIPNITIEFTPGELGLDPYNWETDLKPAVSSHMPFNSSSMMDALITGCPYELYWFDKSSSGGLGMSYSISYSYYKDGETEVLTSVTVESITFKFSVASEFRDQRYTPNTYLMDPTFGTSAQAAATNASNIINEYRDLDDYNKLLAYNNAICNLVSYNTPASQGGVDYGNPWQMIWVFDDNPNNQVVCEGYSKAFQFLCDHSTFNDPQLYVISVSGDAYFTSNSGPHMWNIVHMDDGFNYLIDVTNNDTLNNSLFMVGAPTGSVSQGYTLSNGFRYVYDADTKVDFTTSALTLAPNNYSVPSTTAISFRGHAMQLSGQIGLQYVVELPANTDASQYYIAFTDEHGRTYTSDDLHEYSTTPNYYYAQVNISSILMAENITPKLYLRNAEGEDSVVLVGTPYSARDYINWGLANLSTTSREYKIIKALADYGHYSQPYLSRINGWANDGSVYSQMITYCTDGFEYNDVASAIPENQRIHVNSLSGSGFNAVTYSLRFGDTISLRVFLKADDITAIDNSLFTFTGGRTPVIGRDGDRVTITFNEIPATALTNIYTISYNGNSLVSVSPMSYVYGMLTSTETQDDGRDLVCALYYYAQACAVNN